MYQSMPQEMMMKIYEPPKQKDLRRQSHLPAGLFQQAGIKPTRLQKTQHHQTKGSHQKYRPTT